MNLFKEIKVLFAVNRAITNLQEDHRMNHSYFSSEFVAKVVLELLIIVGALYSIIPPDYALLAVTSLTALYMILRQVNKMKNPQGPGIPALPTIPGIPGSIEGLTTTTTVSTTPPTA